MANLPDSGKVINFAMLIGLLIVLFIVYKLMAAVGLIKTGAAKKEEVAGAAAVTSLETFDYFNPDFYMGKTFSGLSLEQADVAAKNLRKAMRGIGTDEELIYSTFAGLKCKMNISQVADLYKQDSGILGLGSDNLQNDLLNDLKPTEVTKLMTIINKLPNN